MFGLCAFLVLPYLARSLSKSSCGGNSAALAACGSAVVTFDMVSSDHKDRPVSITTMTAVERACFRDLAGLSWIRPATVLVTRAPVQVGAEGAGQIVAVCNTPFSNVPERLFGKIPLTHAVAYADRRTALISVEDFRRLDLHDFIDVRTLPAPEGEPGGAVAESQPIRPATGRPAGDSH